MKRIIAGTIKEFKNQKTNRNNYQVIIFGKSYGRFITEEEAIANIKYNISGILKNESNDRKVTVDICLKGKFRDEINNVYYIFRRSPDGHVETFSSTEYDFRRFNPWLFSKNSHLSLFNRRKYSFADTLRVASVGSRLLNWWRIAFALISIAVVSAMIAIVFVDLNSASFKELANDSFIVSSYGNSAILSIKITLYLSITFIAIALLFDIGALAYSYSIYNSDKTNTARRHDWRQTFKTKINFIELTSSALKATALIMFTTTAFLWFRIVYSEGFTSFLSENLMIIGYLILLVINVIFQLWSLTSILRTRKWYLTHLFTSIEINDFNRWYEDGYESIPYFKKSNDGIRFNIEVGHKYLKHTYNRVAFNLNSEEFKDRMKTIKKDNKVFALVARTSISKRRSI